MARKFAKIKPGIWYQDKFRPLSQNSKLLGMYLMTNEYFSMLGIYRIHPKIMSEDTGLKLDQTKVCLSEMEEMEFCRYDPSSRVVWVVDMALSQVADNPNPKQVKGAQNELARLYEDGYPFIQDFLDLYASRFSLPATTEQLWYDMDTH